MVLTSFITAKLRHGAVTRALECLIERAVSITLEGSAQWYDSSDRPPTVDSRGPPAQHRRVQLNRGRNHRGSLRRLPSRFFLTGLLNMGRGMEYFSAAAACSCQASAGRGSVMSCPQMSMVM